MVSDEKHGCGSMKKSLLPFSEKLNDCFLLGGEKDTTMTPYRFYSFTSPFFTIRINSNGT
jgi:hypothetical protein